MDIYQLYQNEDEYPAFDYEKALSRFQKILRCKTISHLDPNETDFAEFDRLYEILQESYPFLKAKAEWKRFDRNILIKIEGKDPSLKPAMFIAHQDVVPVKTEDWQHDPFGAEIIDGYIWARGALDIKEMLCGFLEAAEYLLSKNRGFERTVYLAFGQDEEVRNTGSKTMGQYLKEKGVELEFVWDESGKIRDGKSYGALDIAIGEIGMFEKGYADIALSVKGIGGHSSVPFDGTSLGKLAQAISKVLDNPLPPRLSALTKEALNILKPHITEEPLKTYVTDMDRYEEEILDLFLKDRDLFALISTTVAPTMITEGSKAGNVLPNDMRAVINFRLIPENTVEDLTEYLKDLLGKDVEVSVVQAINASKVSEYQSYGFEKLTEALGHYYANTVFVPSANTASTDSHNYECVCDCCLRFTPFLEDPAIRNEGIHGNNERLSVRAFKQGMRVILSMMEETCGK